MDTVNLHLRGQRDNFEKSKRINDTMRTTGTVRDKLSMQGFDDQSEQQKVTTTRSIPFRNMRYGSFDQNAAVSVTAGTSAENTARDDTKARVSTSLVRMSIGSTTIEPPSSRKFNIRQSAAASLLPDDYNQPASLGHSSRYDRQRGGA